jgi:hypothetical protein
VLFACVVLAAETLRAVDALAALAAGLPVLALRGGVVAVAMWRDLL